MIDKDTGPRKGQPSAKDIYATVLERPETLAAKTTQQTLKADDGEKEWMRNPLGRGKSVRVLVTGAMGGKEIGKLIKLLEAQKAIFDDDDEEGEEYDL